MLCATAADYAISFLKKIITHFKDERNVLQRIVLPINQSTSMLVIVNSIGLFEAKTKLSEICARVAAKGEAVTVTRRGKPLVTIEPIPAGKARRKSVWDLRAEYEKKHGRFKDDFTLPPREKQAWRNPFEP